jgi:hypothetical protein
MSFIMAAHAVTFEDPDLEGARTTGAADKSPDSFDDLRARSVLLGKEKDGGGGKEVELWERDALGTSPSNTPSAEGAHAAGVHESGDIAFDDLQLKPKRKAARERTPADWRRLESYLDAYARKFIPQHVGQWGVWTAAWPSRGPGWWAAWAPERLGKWQAANALFDSKSRLAPRGIEETRLLIFDVDVHGDPPRGARTLAECLREAKRGVKRKKDRAWRASAALPLFRRFVEAGVPVTPVTTPRGYHFVVVLDRFYPVAEVARVGRAIAAALECPAGCDLEVFPKLRADGVMGDLCGLPLLGPEREVRGDLLTPEGGRDAALDRLLADDGIELETLGDLVEEPPRNPGSETPGSAAVGPGKRPATLTNAEVDRLYDEMDEMTGRPPPRSATVGADDQLHGRAFTARVLELQRKIGRRESQEAMMRLTAAAKYVGLTDPEAVAAIAWYVAQPKHEAAHCRTRAGRAQLLAQVRAHLRHFRQGLVGGACRVGEMRSAPVRGTFAAWLRHSAVAPPCPATTPPRATRSGSSASSVVSTPATRAAPPAGSARASRTSSTTPRTSKLQPTPSKRSRSRSSRSTSNPSAAPTPSAAGSARPSTRAFPSGPPRALERSRASTSRSSGTSEVESDQAASSPAVCATPGRSSG